MASISGVHHTPSRVFLSRTCTTCPQTLNFMKVPVDYQLLVVNSATVLESTFMCWCAVLRC